MKGRQQPIYFAVHREKDFIDMKYVEGFFESSLYVSLRPTAIKAQQDADHFDKNFDCGVYRFYKGEFKRV